MSRRLVCNLSDFGFYLVYSETIKPILLHNFFGSIYGSDLISTYHKDEDAANRN